MSASVLGLHHVTAIAGDPGENLAFYTGILGLRLVKRSVNQDAPDTYHLFYADAEGQPGTDLTFFPWPAMGPARKGAAHAVEVGFSVPPGSLGYWADRLRDAGVAVGDPGERFGEPTLELEDPHGLGLFLAETGRPLAAVPWVKSPVPLQHQLRGFHGVRLLERSLEPTLGFLRDAMGCTDEGEEGGWHRLGAAGGGPGRWLEVRVAADGRLGAWGTGGIHHVAFRIGGDEELDRGRLNVARHGARPTPVIDRFWFHSVYFREPGGVLFELATDGPGFAADEDPEHLGERLVLPPWLEPRRAEIEAALPPLGTPEGDGGLS